MDESSRAWSSAVLDEITGAESSGREEAVPVAALPRSVRPVLRRAVDSVPQPLPQASGYLPTLDGWRAIAVGLVVVSHAIHPEDHWVGRLGPYGVGIFFGISGFLICSRLLDEQERRGRIGLGGFYIRRAFRILPAAWAYLAVAGLLTGLGILTVDSRQFFGCLFISRNYFPLQTTTGDWYTRHFWSLAVEEQFYLFFPLLLWARGAKRARLLVPALAVGVAIWRAVDYRWRILTDLVPGLYPQFRSDTCMDGLLCGCWTALVVRQNQFLRGSRAMFVIGLAALVLAIAGMSGVVPMPGLVLAVLIPWALAGTTLRPNGAMARILEFAPLRWVGRLSYSLYLWQELFFVKRPANVASSLVTIQSLPTNIVCLFICASLSYYLLERPLMRLGHRLAAPATAGRI